jgi:hypothetical protein
MHRTGRRRPNGRVIVIHLGKCLAQVQKGEVPGAATRIRGKITPAESTIATVKERLDLLKTSDPDILSGIEVPNRSCIVDRTFLEGNIDFFLYYLGIATVARDGCIDCGRLVKHLNDCYRCFDVYCNTLQEYFFEKERLSRQKSG